MAVFVILYVVVGVFFGVYFTLGGYKQLDASANGAGLAVRLLWLPAALALWPVLLLKLLPKLLKGQQS